MTALSNPANGFTRSCCCVAGDNTTRVAEFAFAGDKGFKTAILVLLNRNRERLLRVDRRAKALPLVIRQSSATCHGAHR